VTDEGQRRAKARRTAIVLFLVAIGFYVSIYLVTGQN